MSLGSFSDSASIQSQQEWSIAEQLIKTKTQATKFINELNKYQKGVTKKILYKEENQKKFNTKKMQTLKESPLSKPATNFDTQGFSSKYSRSFDNSRSLGKKRVTFDKDCQFKSRTRTTSIKQLPSFNFYEPIKVLALEIISGRISSLDSNSNQTSQSQEKNKKLFTGFTEKQFPDGTKFKGQCENGVIIKGQLTFANGFVYDGQFFLDKFHGKGTLRLPQNQLIEAEWIEGQIIGKATIRYPMGQIYYGDLKNFRRHGQGHLFFNDGSKYEGEFYQGQLTGYGVHITPLGDKTAGYWFYGDFLGTDEQVFENIMKNRAAHEKKKSQKTNKKFINPSKKNVGKSSDFFERFLQDTQALDD